MSLPSARSPEVAAAEQRRRFITMAAAGATLTVMGALFVIPGRARTRQARGERLADGRPRLPPGQRVIQRLRPMGGIAGDSSLEGYRLRVHGLVEHPFILEFGQLMELPQVDRELDVHCVTGWSRLDVPWRGVPIEALAEHARPRPEARHVIFEAAAGYTANLPIEVALDPRNLVAHRVDGEPLARAHGAPVRAVVPARYFWKSAKWLTGIRFVEKDAPGYWEVRGYHNRADPWLEQRHA